MIKICTIFALSCLIIGCSTAEPHQHISQKEGDIKLDGLSTESAWQKLPWKPINQKWLGPDCTPEDFSGRYKLTWDSNYIYLLAEITDDILLDKTADGLDAYWDDDCLEIFIDEDASGGNHQYNYNAFAYHISLDNKTVDIGTDSLAHYYNHVLCQRKTTKNTSTWELAISVYDDSFQIGTNSSPVQLSEGKHIRFAVAYCDNDQSPERENFIGSIHVKGEDKNRGWIDAGFFQKLTLSAH